MNDEAPPRIVLVLVDWYIAALVIAGLLGWWFL